MKKFFVGSLVFLFAFCVNAQSAENITDILNTENVTFGQLCYIVAVHEHFIDDSASYTEAVSAVYRHGMIPHLVYEDTLVPLVNMAYLYSQIFDIKGGLLFSLFHGAPRYAYKQMKSDGVLPKNAFPNKLCSGQEMLDMYTACLMEYTDVQLSVE